MEKMVSQLSYWLGLACVAIALVMRGFNALGVWMPGTVIEGVTIWYMSFYKGALLFLLVSIAANSEWFRHHKS
jgi:hypothetical protein